MQCRAVQALCGVFVGSPRLMLSQDMGALIGDLLGVGYSDMTHLKLLEALQDLLLDEEVGRVGQVGGHFMRRQVYSCVMYHDHTVRSLAKVEWRSDNLHD